MSTFLNRLFLNLDLSFCRLERPLFLPLLSHQTLTSPASVTPTTHERSFFPNPSTHQLQSHSAAAPFLPFRTDEGYILEMWSDPTAGCDGTPNGRTAPRLRLDLVASLVKLGLRYRMTAVAWGIGVVALVLARQVGAFRLSGESQMQATEWTDH